MAKRWLILAGVALLAGLAGGCSIQEDMVRLDLRLAEVERAQQGLSDRLDGLDGRQAAAVENRDRQMGEVRAQYAETRAQIKRLQSEMARLRGRIEESEHGLGKRLEAARRDETRRGGHLDRLEAELARGLDRLAAVETYLNLEVAPAATAASPGAQPPAGGAPDDAPEAPGPALAAPAENAAPSAPPDEHTLYADAKRAFDQGDLETARQGFVQLLAHYPRSDHADNAQFWIGEAYYREQWYEKAILEYQKVIENYPKGNKVPASLLKQGLAFFNLGDGANARLVLKELIRKYPKSNEAQIARQKVKGSD